MAFIPRAQNLKATEQAQIYIGSSENSMKVEKM
jgi:hypothetical protein